LTAVTSIMAVALKVPRPVIVPAVQLNGSFCVSLQVCLPHLKRTPCPGMNGRRIRHWH
jgi:hypothetical protein